MKRIEKYLIKPDMKVYEAIKIIDLDRLAVVVDDDMKLLGVVSDGDVRRYLLQGKSLSLQVGEMMNRNPIVVSPTSQPDVQDLARTRLMRVFPEIDATGRLIDVIFVSESSQNKSNIVVLMAGGMGQRLLPLTEKVPKPMLKIGDRPILESIIMKFAEQGFTEFRVSVNHMADMIKDYFRDGTPWGVNIQYLHEDKKMGTAGSLSLLEDSPKDPIIVMNGDVLTKVNFDNALHFHHDHQAEATMCVRQFDFQVPYGVVNIDEDSQAILGIDEKPTHSFFVNAGIYILNPGLLKLVDRDHYLDMPTLFHNIREMGHKSIPFPLREYWVDIGQVDQYDRACMEFGELFETKPPHKSLN